MLTKQFLNSLASVVRSYELVCLKTLDCKFSGFKENEEVIVVAWPHNVLLVLFILSVILVDIFFNIKTCA